MIRINPYALKDKIWRKGDMTRRVDERCYEVMSDGNNIRTSRVQLRQTKEPPQERLSTTLETTEPRWCHQGSGEIGTGWNNQVLKIFQTPRYHTDLLKPLEEVTEAGY